MFGLGRIFRLEHSVIFINKARDWGQKLSSEAMHVYKCENRFSLWSYHIGTVFKSIQLSFDIYKVSNHHQCWKLSQKSCRSSCLESQIINIKLKKNQQKVPGPPPKLSASDRRTCGNFQHWSPLNSWYPSNDRWTTQLIQISMSHHILPVLRRILSWKHQDMPPCGGQYDIPIPCSFPLNPAVLLHV